MVLQCIWVLFSHYFRQCLVVGAWSTHLSQTPVLGFYAKKTSTGTFVTLWHQSLSIGASFCSIPSFSRTSSSFADSDALLISESKVSSQERSNKKLHPVLAACEKKSKFSTQTVCATCRKVGYDYPRCAKCGEMWCSRICRLRGGAKRHVCSRKSN